MQITVSGRRVELDADLKSHAMDKVEKLERYYDRVGTADVVFDVNGLNHSCEIIARADHHTTFVAREEHADAFVCLDAAVKDLERQLSRHKEKHRNRKHATGSGDRDHAGGPAAHE